MSVLNLADAVYLGATPADRVYSGDTQVWPPPPPFAPSNPVLDDFNRADGAVGADWIGAGFDGTGAGLQIVGNKVSAGYASDAWKTWIDGDAEVYVDLVCDLGDTSLTAILWICLQQSAIDNPGGWTSAGYQCKFFRTDATRGGIQIRRGTGSGATTLWNGNIPVLPGVGDTLLARMAAGVLSLWLKHGGEWMSLVDVSDSTYNSGYIGFEGWGGGIPMDVDNFGGGAL